MLQLTSDDFKAMEQRFRACLVNSLRGVAPLHLVGTIGIDKTANLAPFNSVIHIGANPPLMGLIFRPDTVERHTLQNIRENKQFTINNVPTDLVASAHQSAAKYAANISEFDACGFTKTFQPNFDAPFVDESTIQIGLSLKEEILIQLNKTILIVAEIVFVSLPQKWVAADGFVNHQDSAGVIGLDGYTQSTLLNRFSYPKPDLPLNILK